jgi:hypothetical protein
MKQLSVLYCVVVFSCMAQTGVVFDNLSGVTGNSDSVEIYGPLYDSFSTGPAGLLSDVQLLLSGDNTSSGEVAFGLYADQSTSPGTLIVPLGSLADSSLTNTPSIFDLALSSGLALAADTRYWIGLSGATTTAWAWSTDVSGVGVESEFFANASGVYADDPNGPYQMSVAVAPLPEPSSFLLLAAGLGFLGLVRQRVSASARSVLASQNAQGAEGEADGMCSSRIFARIRTKTKQVSASANVPASGTAVL